MTTKVILLALLLTISLINGRGVMKQARYIK
ncbi:hypothetical protein Hamer_G015842 [Homarus americanus]|uniref:Uncharacterized protein n=1 Tax=Homarus americanus TaxID=6706 RepID=A0A8J5JGU2_HOMAM|nr:hypothetical protein Hamer_G015842 [Homarus americanus]